jgi:hypothetical protein
MAKAPLDPKRGKGLSALLQILRSAGVTSYETPDLKLTLGPKPPGKVVTSFGVSPEALAADASEVDDGDPEPEDFRFALETRMRKHFPAPKADPRKNGGAQ